MQVLPCLPAKVFCFYHCCRLKKKKKALVLQLTQTRSYSSHLPTSISSPPPPKRDFCHVKFASLAWCAFGCLIKFKVDEVGKILLTKTFQLSWAVWAEPGLVRSLLPAHPGGWGLLANQHWKEERSHLSCFSCSQKSVTEGVISHHTWGVWTAGCLFLPLASPREGGELLHCIPSGSSNHMAVEFLLQLLDLMHQDIHVKTFIRSVAELTWFCAERAGVCNLKDKKCIETGFLFRVIFPWLQS